MRPSPPTAERLSVGWSAIREGLRFLRGKQVLQGTFYIDLIAMIFGIPVALYPAFVLDVLGRIAWRSSGFLYAAEALGALLVALFSGRAKHVRRQGLVTIVACMCWGAGIIGFGLSPTLWVAIVFLMLASASDMVSGLYRDAILKTVTPDEMRGRMEGVSLVGRGDRAVARATPRRGCSPRSRPSGSRSCRAGSRASSAPESSRSSFRVPALRRGEPRPVGPHRIFRNTGGRIRSPPARSEDQSAGGASVRRASASRTVS